MEKQDLLEAFRKLASQLEGIDTAVYEHYQLAPTEPIIGEGYPNARIAIFGRDPGRDEVRYRLPFIGAGGQKVRQVLHEMLYSKPLANFEASMEVGRYVFWANTVPYKPFGNKAWSQKVKKAFQPFMAQLLLSHWQGQHVLTLGREAFLWFGIGLNRDERKALEAFWKSPNRFEDSYLVTLSEPDGLERTLHLHPLPHPSPLNATWYKRFPQLLENRLKALDFSLDQWQLS